MNGFLLIDKKKGESSFDAVCKIKKLYKEPRVGHAGTLDPLATGLLIVALGEGTKLLEYLLGCEKEYEVTAYFGSISDTYDAEGKITKNKNCKKLTEVQILKATKKFIGTISQMPPKYSALKVKGRRACDLMREGKDVDLKPRKIKIRSIKLIDFTWPRAKLLVSCGAGTYIRSLVHDLGKALKCGAYVEELRRTKIGDFSIKNTSVKAIIPLEGIAKKFSPINLSEKEMEGLKDGKTLMNKKIEQRGVWTAFYKGKFIGVLEKANKGKGVKFRKLIVAD